MSKLEQQVVFAVHQRVMRTIGLVEAEDVIVDVEGLHVDRPVRGIGDGINADLGATGMDEIGDLADRIDGAEDVRAMSHTDELRALAHQGGEIGEVE